MSKKRLDVLLVEKSLAATREKAKRLIMAGLVFADQQRLDKPGMQVDESINLTVKGKLLPYVGRGGLKLEKALKTFSLTVTDKIVMDIGSSTGGFTDCALQNGASLCYAIDVGYNQLDWKLRNDDRVIVMERTNFRYVTVGMLENGKPNFASIDVSFISLRLLLPVLKHLLENNSDVVALVKPQFEAGKEQVGKKGVVRDSRVHQAVLRQIIDFAAQEKFQILDLTFSPITGGDGNIEFLLHLGWEKHKPATKDFSDHEIESLVSEAHEALARKKQNNK
ncbi:MULTISPECIES: TlyA family RNA methyltransferase [Virgibacillus]|uniref:Hemolysin A n=1 Tax=Virgibacillus dokdonensis TaxID=302167 RepID=A0A2K9J5E2_9BACI|nr:MULTISPECIES: TlyA family RNA methyltransferase [Virgibacillus]AUJ26313.1 Hemolysin A [Virgibacillus dokdonensis]NWO14621.1 TlyA family RNA methyltransferase [Virgibacillus sp.]